MVFLRRRCHRVAQTSIPIKRQRVGQQRRRDPRWVAQVLNRDWLLLRRLLLALAAQVLWRLWSSTTQLHTRSTCRYFCRWLATCSRVTPCTSIIVSIVLGMALSMPSCSTASTKRACRSGVHTKRVARFGGGGAWLPSLLVLAGRAELLGCVAACAAVLQSARRVVVAAWDSSKSSSTAVLLHSCTSALHGDTERRRLLRVGKPMMMVRDVDAARAPPRELRGATRTPPHVPEPLFMPCQTVPPKQP